MSWNAIFFFSATSPAISVHTSSQCSSASYALEFRPCSRARSEPPSFPLPPVLSAALVLAAPCALRRSDYRGLAAGAASPMGAIAPTASPTRPAACTSTIPATPTPMLAPASTSPWDTRATRAKTLILSDSRPFSVSVRFWILYGKASAGDDGGDSLSTLQELSPA